MNVLWEMAAAERVLHGVLEGARGLIHGVTCAPACRTGSPRFPQHGIHYYPIVSSARAFRALWKRGYHKFCDWMGGVVTRLRGSPAAITASPTARIGAAGAGLFRGCASCAA